MGQTPARTDALLPQLETGKINCVRRPHCGRLSPCACLGQRRSRVKVRNQSGADWLGCQTSTDESHVAFEVGADLFGCLAGGRVVRLYRHRSRERGYRAYPVLYLRGDIPGPAGLGPDGLSSIARATAAALDS